MRRRVGLLAATVATLLLAAGCPKPSEPPVTPTQSGAVAWRNCFDKAKAINSELTRREYTVECGTVTVPRDWDKPDNGETFSIAVMRIYTGEIADKKGSIVTNPGGPGASGIEHVPSLIAAGRGGPGADALLHDFALLSFDPRGVGESGAINCFTDEDLDALFGFEPDPVSQARFDTLVELNQRVADRCEDLYGDDLPLYSTVQAARDLDAIRAAIGDEKLTYLGFSYGTLLGAVYAQLFPDKIRALVLDGAVDPTNTSIEGSEGQAMGFERALTNFSAWCRQHPSDCPISADPKGAITAQLQRTVTNPVRGEDGREATAGWVQTAVSLSMYTMDAWPYLGPAIDDLSRGDPTLIFFLADLYASRDEDGHYGTMWGAFSAINCTDEEYPPLDEIRNLQADWRAKYPIFGAASATGLVSCSVWKAKKDPYPTGPAVGAPKIVVVGTTGDPATPYESTQKLADMLGSDVGVVVTNEGEGHTGYPGSSCINRAVEDYLIDLEVPRDGLRCD